MATKSIEKKQVTSTGNLQSFLSMMASRRAEEEQRRDLEMQFKIDEGTATYDDQINYLKEKSKWYFKGSAKYQANLNNIQSVEQEAEEVDLQYMYKTGQITDTEILEKRKDQLKDYSIGSEKYYAMSQEIYSIEKRMSERNDTEEMQRFILDYKNNYKTADDMLTYLQSRLDYMEGDGSTFYSDDQRAEMRLKVQEQTYNLENLNREAEKLTQDIAYENDVDKLAAGQTYIDELNSRLDTERDPIERIRIQGQIDSQVETLRQIERDRGEMDSRIKYAKKEINEKEFYEALSNIASNETNPDKRLQYELEAGAQYRKYREKEFSDSLQYAKNSYATSQNEKDYLSSLQSLKNEFGADSQFSFELDALLAPQQRRVLGEEFQNDFQDIKNDFAKHKNKETYVADIQALLGTYGEDSVFSFELYKELAEQEGNLSVAEFNGEMSVLSNKLLKGEISEADYQTEVQKLYDSGKYDFTSAIEYQTQKENVLSQSERNNMEDLYNTKVSEIENKYAKGQLNDAEYQASLEDLRENADAYGYGALLNIPSYANKIDSIISNVTGGNIKKEIQSQIEDIKNQYSAKDINYEEYLNKLTELDGTIQTQYSDLYDSYFKSTMKGLLADATGNSKEKEFNNLIADMQRKYNNHEYDNDGIENATGYINDLNALMKSGGYKEKDSEYGELKNEISRMTEVKVGLNFDKDYSALENAYKKNQTAKGLEKFLSGLQSMKGKNKYAKREDLLNKIDGQISSLQGNKGEAEFQNKLGSLKTKLYEGVITAQEYLNRIGNMESDYFGKDAKVKLNEDYKNYLTREIKGESGSYINEQYTRQVDDLTNKYHRGEIKADDLRNKLLDWQQKGTWGTGNYITQQVNQNLTDIETEMGQEQFKSYQEYQQERIAKQQTLGSKAFSEKEKAFETIKSQYAAEKTDFNTYEAARKEMGGYQTKYEDWLSQIEQIKAPEFKFEEWKPGSKGLEDIKLPELKL